MLRAAKQLVCFSIPQGYPGKKPLSGAPAVRGVSLRNLTPAERGISLRSTGRALNLTPEIYHALPLVSYCHWSCSAAGHALPLITLCCWSHTVIDHALPRATLCRGSCSAVDHALMLVTYCHYHARQGALVWRLNHFHYYPCQIVVRCRCARMRRRKTSCGRLFCADRSETKTAVASSIRQCVQANSPVDCLIAEGKPTDGCKMVGIIIVKMIETLHQDFLYVVQQCLLP